MATFLINASNLKKGGGLQVADSICTQLYRFPQHRFIVVLSTYMRETKKRLENVKNVHVVEYNIRNNIPTLLFGYDKVLNSLVKDHDVQAVLTVFGPSRWNPRVPHLSGFAMPHVVIPESPYFVKAQFSERLNWFIRVRVLTYLFRRSTSLFWTENPFISARLSRLMNCKSKTYSGGGKLKPLFSPITAERRAA